MESKGRLVKKQVWNSKTDSSEVCQENTDHTNEMYGKPRICSMFFILLFILLTLTINVNVQKDRLRSDPRFKHNATLVIRTLRSLTLRPRVTCQI